MTAAVALFATRTTGAQWAAAKEAQLTASDAAADDQFGGSVCISGDTAIAGASYDDLGVGGNAGSAYVFVRSGTSWTEQQKLVASDGTDNDIFGWSVALSGDTAVIGAIGCDLGLGKYQGAVYVFVRSGASWIEQQKLIAPDGADGDRFGTSVAISGDTVVVGAHVDDYAGMTDAGSAYVFVRSGTIWSAQQKLLASDPAPGDNFGCAVAISGGTALIGANDDDRDASDAGSAYVFVRSGTSWTEQQLLTASVPGENDWFGFSVACSGDTALIGAWNDDHSSEGQGSAYVFVRDRGTWSQQAKLVASDAKAGDAFGYSVALHDDLALIGALLDNHSGDQDAGSAYLFGRNGTSWTEEAKLIHTNPSNLDQFGRSVALSDDTAVAGVHWDDVQGMVDAGSAHVFRISPGPVTYCTAGTSASGCQALLSASGTASATASSGFTLQAATVEGQKDGLFFFGTNGQQANSWGNGTSYQCVVPPVVRTQLLTGTGTNGLCDGALSLDMNAVWTNQPHKNPGAGAVVQAQLWYRDPLSTSNQSTSLWDAIEFVLAQ